jgi:putative ABC transport system ATP-binding protein
MGVHVGRITVSCKDCPIAPRKFPSESPSPLLSPPARVSMNQPAILSLEDVHLTLGSRAGDVHILRGVSLAAKAGEAIGIVGPSGSGKTSLLMVIAGLEPVSSGQITVRGTALHDKSEEALARFRRDTIGIMSSSPSTSSPPSPRSRMSPFPWSSSGLWRTPIDRARAALGSGSALVTVSTHYPGQLSGGEQQRVAIARALAVCAQRSCWPMNPPAISTRTLANPSSICFSI